MLNARQRTSLYSKICLLAIYLLVAAAAFHGSYNKWHFAEPGVRGESSRTNIEAILDGTAPRPFIYRQLLPAAANFLEHHLPRRWLAAVFAHQGSDPSTDPPGPLEALASSPTTRNPAYLYRYLLLYSETFLAALVALCAMHLLCKRLAREGEPWPVATTHIAPAIVLLLIPYLQSAGGYYYDYPELAFLALAAWVALGRGWFWLLPLAALGTLNKESFVLFLPTLYPLLRRYHSRTRSAAAITLAAAVCIAVYLPIQHHFASNPGGAVEFHLRDQLAYLTDIPTLFLGTESTYGIRVVKAFSVLPLTLLLWTTVRGWKRLCKPLQRHAQIAALINLPLFFLFCWPSEMRNLSLLYPTFLALVAANLIPQQSTTRTT
jgi:hypothetical protein